MKKVLLIIIFITIFFNINIKVNASGSGRNHGGGGGTIDVDKILRDQCKGSPKEMKVACDRIYQLCTEEFDAYVSSDNHIFYERKENIQTRNMLNENIVKDYKIYAIAYQKPSKDEAEDRKTFCMKIQIGDNSNYKLPKGTYFLFGDVVNNPKHNVIVPAEGTVYNNHTYNGRTIINYTDNYYIDEWQTHEGLNPDLAISNATNGELYGDIYDGYRLDPYKRNSGDEVFKLTEDSNCPDYLHYKHRRKSSIFGDWSVKDEVQFYYSNNGDLPFESSSSATLKGCILYDNEYIKKLNNIDVNDISACSENNCNIDNCLEEIMRLSKYDNGFMSTFHLKQALNELKIKAKEYLMNCFQNKCSLTKEDIEKLKSCINDNDDNESTKECLEKQQIEKEKIECIMENKDIIDEGEEQIEELANAAIEENNQRNNGMFADFEIKIEKIDFGTRGNSCGNILGPTFTKIISVCFIILRIVGAIIAIVNAMISLVPAVLAKDADAIKKASSKCIKMAVVLVVIGLFPTVLNLIGKIFGFDLSCIF